MIGAIVGDVVGSRFEWNNISSKDFALFTPRCRPTDDSVMTLAIAKALMKSGGGASFGADCVECMQELGRKYPDAGYGGNFIRWLRSPAPIPYGSWGNGSAMRVSPCGFTAATLEEAILLARTQAGVSHNHPEGLRGAEATAAAIFLAKSGRTKEDIHAFITERFYEISFTLDEIRDGYTFDVSCQGSVPQALEAFFEAEDFEDAIRGAISIGGDSDTIAAITGGIAEAYYGVPEDIRNGVLGYLDDDMKAILDTFEKKYPR